MLLVLVLTCSTFFNPHSNYAELTLKDFSLHWANVQMILPLDFSNAAMILEFTKTQQKTLNVIFFFAGNLVLQGLRYITHWLRPRNRNPSPICTHISCTRALLMVSQNRRNLFVTPCLKQKKNFSCLYTFKLKEAVVRAMIFVLRYFCMV